MEKILALLTNLEKAKAMKERLKAMPRHEKAKPTYKKLWILVCDKVNLYEQTKDKPQKHIEKTKATPKPKKIKPDMPPQFTPAEIEKTTQALEKQYPKLFNRATPKPLKIGTLEDILASGNHWNPKLLKRTIKLYVRTEPYYLACAMDNYRYDLADQVSGEIAAKNKQNAIDQIRVIIGRFEMPKVYPQLALKQKLPTPRIIKSAFYGNHYYHHEIYVETKRLLTECYGNTVKMSQTEEQIKRNKHQSIRSVIKNGITLFEVEAEAKTKKLANQLSAIKLLMHLQNTIDAYPFEYEKQLLSYKKIEKEMSY